MSRERLTPVHLTAKGRRWQRTGHPWVYRSDLAAGPELTAGDLVAVLDHQGEFLGQAFYSAASRIALRFVTFGAEKVDEAFWDERLKQAVTYRRQVVQDSEAYRLIYGEADGFPGLVVDRYGDHLAVQALHPGLERRLGIILELLKRHLRPRSITLRHDAEVRRLEGLPQEVVTVWGELPSRVQVCEAGLQLGVDIRGGQKTGMFLDQRENRLLAGQYARGTALDAFAYQGGFGLHLARRAAKVTLVETSAPALGMAQDNALQNGLVNLELVQANVFAFLKQSVQNGRRFDTIVLDPPAFAKSKGDRPAALRGYREINRRACQLLNPGGMLITCSCSYNISEAEFLEVVRQAAADSRRQARLVERRGAARDHPALLSLPESLYLKSLVLQVY
jgi:23S rRNA (cytosine1962-C5)-methyltransferase